MRQAVTIIYYYFEAAINYQGSSGMGLEVQFQSQSWFLRESQDGQVCE